MINFNVFILRMKFRHILVSLRADLSKFGSDPSRARRCLFITLWCHSVKNNVFRSGPIPIKIEIREVEWISENHFPPICSILSQTPQFTSFYNLPIGKIFIKLWCHSVKNNIFCSVLIPKNRFDKFNGFRRITEAINWQKDFRIVTSFQSPLPLLSPQWGESLQPL